MSSGRRKGHDFERLIAIKFRRWFPDAKRGLQYQSGTNCPDIVGTPFFIECKYAGKKHANSLDLQFGRAYDQSLRWGQEDSGRLLPVLLVRRLAYQPIWVTMERQDVMCPTAPYPEETNITDRGDKDWLVSLPWGLFQERMDNEYKVVTT